MSYNIRDIGYVPGYVGTRDHGYEGDNPGYTEPIVQVSKSSKERYAEIKAELLYQKDFEELQIEMNKFAELEKQSKETEGVGQWEKTTREQRRKDEKREKRLRTDIDDALHLQKELKDFGNDLFLNECQGIESKKEGRQSKGNGRSITNLVSKRTDSKRLVNDVYNFDDISLSPEPSIKVEITPVKHMKGNGQPKESKRLGNDIYNFDDISLSPEPSLSGKITPVKNITDNYFGTITDTAQSPANPKCPTYDDCDVDIRLPQELIRQVKLRAEKLKNEVLETNENTNVDDNDAPENTHLSPCSSNFDVISTTSSTITIDLYKPFIIAKRRVRYAKMRKEQKENEQLRLQMNAETDKSLEEATANQTEKRSKNKVKKRSLRKRIWDRVKEAFCINS